MDPPKGMRILTPAQGNVEMRHTVAVSVEGTSACVHFFRIPGLKASFTMSHVYLIIYSQFIKSLVPYAWSYVTTSVQTAMP